MAFTFLVRQRQKSTTHTGGYLAPRHLRLFLCVQVLGALSGCAPRLTPRVNAELSPTVSPSQADSIAANRTQIIALRPSTSRYTYRANATITAIDSISRTDSIQTSAVVTVTLTASISSDVEVAIVQVDSAVIQASSSTTSSTTINQSEEHKASINTKTGHVGLLPREQLCTQQSNEPILRGDEVLPVIRRVIETQRWIDTSQYQFCRGGINFQMTRIAEYFATTLSDTSANNRYITRTVAIELRGQGTQWQQSVQALGHGSATDTLYLTEGFSRLQRLVTHSQVSIDFLSTMRMQHFIQAVSAEFIIQD